MNFPEELIDEVLGGLPRRDRRFLKTLRSCSLVSKSWVEPSRRLLFANVSIDFVNCQLWLDKISPTSTGLLRHIRSLIYFSPMTYCPDPDRYHLYTFREYLPSLSQLRALTLDRVDIESTVSEHLDMFSAFQHTLSSLHFNDISITWNAFVTLIGLFPNLRALKVTCVSFKEDNSPTPSLAHPPRGSLCANLMEPAAKLLTDKFHELRPEYEELEICWEPEYRLLAAVKNTLKHLNISTKPPPTFNLSRFPELRQLEVSASFGPDATLISSIASINLRKIVFVAYWIQYTSEWEVNKPVWIRFDDTLCQLVGKLRKLGYQHTLEVEFRAVSMDVTESYLFRLLPKFREIGRVEFVIGGLYGYPIRRRRDRKDSWPGFEAEELSTMFNDP